jgi:Succinylglutamate desuccinylase / Aspartoacylase family
VTFREILRVERLGKNLGSYLGEKIDIHAVLRDIDLAAQEHGWTSEIYHQTPEFKFLALHHKLSLTLNSPHSTRIYLSAGIHGDEPAGPLAALRLLQENRWPPNAELWFCPCLNPMGFVLNRRENPDGKDLNRDYRHSETAEVRTHVAWLERQPRFDVYFCLHEDWESHGFYLYEQNPEQRPSLAENIMEAVQKVCPIDRSDLIEGRPANGGIIRPILDPNTRPQWAEVFYLITHKARHGYTLEAPSDFPLPTRVKALVMGVNAALESFNHVKPPFRSA